MKPKLKIFETFSQSLLPHEAQYLSKLSNFQDVGKLDIFNKLVHNALYPNQSQEFDEEIDKRKYHYIKSWVEKRLECIDVDKVGDWILNFKRKLYLDLVTSQEEREILDYIQNYKKISFNFGILYETMKEYRSYLMIRLRYEDHEVVKSFLEGYASVFHKFQEIKDKLYQATIDITQQYTSKHNDNVYWEKWLYKVFKTQDIDGSNRYKAFILLAFMYNSQNNTTKLKQIFDDIDVFFAQGQMYCRRLLYNYYSSRVLLHSKQNETEKAIYYGRLSIRHDNEDTLMYVNNLVSIYLRAQEFAEAKKLLDEYQSYFEVSHNFYRRITFMSYQIRVLSELHQYLTAENLGIYFLKKYGEEILQYRWHHFFTSYINVLLRQEKYTQIVQLERKYHLIERETKRKSKADFIPNITWAIYLAKYMENSIEREDLVLYIEKSLEDLNISESNANVFKNVYNLLTKNLPELTKIFKSYVA